MAIAMTLTRSIRLGIAMTEPTREGAPRGLRRCSGPGRPSDRLSLHRLLPGAWGTKRRVRPKGTFPPGQGSVARASWCRPACGGVGRAPQTGVAVLDCAHRCGVRRTPPNPVRRWRTGLHPKSSGAVERGALAACRRGSFLRNRPEILQESHGVPLGPRLGNLAVLEATNPDAFYGVALLACRREAHELVFERSCRIPARYHPIASGKDLLDRELKVREAAR